MAGLFRRIIAKIRPVPYNKFAAFCETGQKEMRFLTAHEVDDEYKKRSTAFLSHCQFCEVCSHAEVQTS